MAARPERREEVEREVESAPARVQLGPSEPLQREDTTYCIAFSREFIDFRADLDLLADVPPSSKGGQLCLRDWEPDEAREAVLASPAGGGALLKEFVDEHIGGNPIDTVYDAAVLLGNGTEVDRILWLAGTAGADSQDARDSLKLWIENGIMVNQEGLIFVTERMGPWCRHTGCLP